MDLSVFTNFDFSVIWRYLPALLKGLWTNCFLTALGFLCGGIVLGTILAFGNMARLRIIRWPAFLFVEFWRSTPLLVQAVWMHFAFPVLTGFSTTPLQSGLLALIFNVSAYCSEIIRAGIMGVPRGQYEAARALGLSAPVTWWKVIRPQAIRLIVPPLTGTVISIFKATAILSILAINDLMRAAARISSYTIRPVEIYTTAAILALMTGLVITWIGSRAEVYYRRQER